MTSAVRQRPPALVAVPEHAVPEHAVPEHAVPEHAVPEHRHAFATSLEEELASVLRESGLRGRQARAVARRLGWSGHGATTLAEAAAEEGYTRERVRQLEDRLRRHAKETPLSLPLTAAALRLAENAAPVAYSQVRKDIAHAGLSAAPFDLSGVLSAAELGRLDIRVCERDGVVLREGDAAFAGDVGSVANKLVKRNGAGTVAALAGHFPGDEPAGTARRVLAAQSNVIWLDDRREWFLVRGVRTPVGNALRKMLSVSPSLTLADVDEGLRRSFRPVKLPPDVLLQVCESTPWLTVHDGHTVTAKIALDEARFLSSLERSLARIFREAGPVLSFSAALRLGEQSGLNPNSVGLYLLRSPVLRKVARGRYRLCGL
jgi:hypothetical protein